MKTLAVLAVIALPAVAAAQPGNYYAPSPPPPWSAPAVEPEPTTRLEIGMIAGSPKGMWEAEIEADTSPGLHLQVGFTVAPSVSAFGGVRYIRVNYDEDRVGSTDLRISHRELQLGLRYMSPISPAAKFFVEGNVHSATVTASLDGESDSESGVGLGARAGVVLMVDRKIGLGLAVGYASADIELGEGESLDDAWLTGDVGLSFFF